MSSNASKFGQTKCDWILNLAILVKSTTVYLISSYNFATTHHRYAPARGTGNL